MVLIAATALTIFSLLGSAAITGLIPTVPYAKQGLLQDISENVPSRHSVNSEKKAPQSSESSKLSVANNQELLSTDDLKKNHAQSETKLCQDCGVIISIKLIEQASGTFSGNVINHVNDSASNHTAYLIKVQMENGGYRLITQYSLPQHSIGDIVKLNSNQLVNA
jgi:hypothetical protein